MVAKGWKIVGAVALVLGSVVAGYLLANDQFTLAALIGLTVWLLLLPYHGRLAVILSVSCFNAALIVPFAPGRPFVWEFSALLAWTGLLVTLAMKQYPPDYWRQLGSNKLLFIGLLGFTGVLLTLIVVHGVGFRAFGSGGQMGGRNYVQQLLCVVFPFLFVAIPPGEKLIVRLFTAMWILSLSFLVSEFALAYGGDLGPILLTFLELSTDALNFEIASDQMGFRRYQSFYYIATGAFLLMWSRRNLADYLGGQGWWMILLSLGAIAIAGLSGHRFTFLFLTLTALFLAWSQRFFTPRRLVLGLFLGLVVLGSVYVYSRSLPLAAQRSISFLPGIDVDPVARSDGSGTLAMRRIMRRIGWEMAPDHLWVGRGFGTPAVDYSHLWDPTGVTRHVNLGRFYNGFVGLLVNTGIPGLTFMLMFQFGGTFIAFKIMRHLRREGCEDDFVRVAGILAAMWMADLIAFHFFHGNAEIALRRFGLQAGLLLACWRCLEAREAARMAPAMIQSIPAAAPALRRVVPVG